MSLRGLSADDLPDSMAPQTGVAAAKRVGDIFHKPQFVVDGATASDVKQGAIGDCWFLAAVTALSGTPSLLMRLCVERDEQAGVYGFCFFRDGQWIYEVVDDRLCVRYPEDPRLYLLQIFGDMPNRDTSWDNMAWEWLPKEMRQKLLKGQRTLYFSSCKQGEETWLPLIEKAYAKAHGDYQAIEGGSAGEGIEDLTGGVNVSLNPEDILDRDRLWNELTQVNEAFLFGCGSPREESENEESHGPGLVSGHAYTVLEAKEVETEDHQKVKLLKIRNPWGNTEWKGPWSDGSKEWTPEMMQELKHRFGDDGIFWITFDDWLQYYRRFDRTRLFGPEWTVTQEWTSVEVPQSVNYLDTEYIATNFTIQIEEKCPVVIVMAKPDYRYFDGLRGRFKYDLHFRLYKDGEESYLVRSMEQNVSGRSCSTELEVDPGLYTVRIKISPQRYSSVWTVEEIIDDLRGKNEKWIMEKILAVGKSFDAAHSKGHLREAEAVTSKRLKKDAQKSEHDGKRKERTKLREDRRRKRLRSERIRTEREKKKEVKRVAKRAKKQKEREIPKDKAQLVTTAATPPEENKETAAGTDAAAPEEDKQEGPQTEDSNGFENVDPKAADYPTPKEEPERGPEPKSEPEKAKAAPGPAPEPEQEQEQEQKPEAGKEAQEAEDKGEHQRQRGECCSDDDGISEISSVLDEDFEWDSEIDGSVDEPEDGPAEKEAADDGDPWNAICVLGLRVYSTSAKTRLELVKP